MIGLAAGLLNIVPYLGSIIGLGIALPLDDIYADVELEFPDGPRESEA